MADCDENCSSCDVEGCSDRTGPQELKVHEGTKIDKVIAIASGKGGVGKSLTTSLLACELQRRGKKVGILDGDITGPSIPRSFGLHEPPQGDEDGMILPEESKTGIKVISTNMLIADEGAPFLWRGPVLNGVIQQFYGDINWGELDYLLVDMPPGTGDVPMTVFQSLPVKGVVVATSPQVLVNMIVEKAIRMADHMDVPVVGLVENMSYFECPECGHRSEIFGPSEVEAIAADKKIDAWTRIPIDPKISAMVDEGKAEEIEGDWFKVIADKLETL
ncbi:MAG: Mrp/NBP35 family ATP-binding protein [Coriobacteriaceae bacterium]|nr:Mrp/NBP35 family ATP-binding protein [Coriobacteriaceae bacterium]